MTPRPGKDYRALRRLADVENATLADVGETCEHVPSASLDALRASGKIELAVERRIAERPPSSKKAIREKR